jgi:hypothetical protein
MIKEADAREKVCPLLFFASNTSAGASLMDEYASWIFDALAIVAGLLCPVIYRPGGRVKTVIMPQAAKIEPSEDSPTKWPRP